MAKKKLGNKYACYQCGCKFYDLCRPQPICPKCGANQNDAPKKGSPSPPKSAGPAVAVPRPRPRKRRDNKVSLEPGLPLAEEEAGIPSPLENGLSLIDDEDLIGAGRSTPSEED